MNVSIGSAQARATIAKAKAKAEELASALNQRYSVDLALPTSEAKHLAWFDAGTSRQPRRPVLVLNEYARQRVVAAMELCIRTDIASERTPNVLVALTLGANAAREVWVTRLERNGGDVRLAQLSPRYLRSKIRRGLDRRIGVATGAMLAAVRRSQIVVRRIGGA